MVKKTLNNKLKLNHLRVVPISWSIKVSLLFIYFFGRIVDVCIIKKKLGSYPNLIKDLIFPIARRILPNFK